jgi:hypothetical protein
MALEFQQGSGASSKARPMYIDGRRLAGAETERFLARALVGFSSNPFLSTRIMQGSKSWPPQDAYDHLAYLCATDKRTAKALAIRALRGSAGKLTATGLARHSIILA